MLFASSHAGGCITPTTVRNFYVRAVDEYAGHDGVSFDVSKLHPMALGALMAGLHASKAGGPA